MKSKLNLILCFLSLLCVLIISCSGAWVKREEISKNVSPDSLVDALIYRTNAGATTSFSYEVFIVPHGKVPDINTVLFKADHVKELSVEWKSDGILDIVYSEARIFHFTNFWQSKEVQNFSYVVELQLSPTRDGHSLSDYDRWIKDVGPNRREVIPGLPSGLPQ